MTPNDDCIFIHMKTEHNYRWRIQWCGRWTTTRHHCTEEQIRREHPEAQRLDETLIVREVPETDDEHAQMQRRNSMSGLQRGAFQ